MELASETTVAKSSLNTMVTKSKNTGEGKDNHVDVVETNQPSETASTISAIESGDADESMNEHGETWNRGMATDTQSIRAEHCRNDQWVTLTRPR